MEIYTKDVELQNRICCLIVFGAFGAVTKNLMMWVIKIGTPGILNLLQKTCLLGTAKILRRTLDT